MMVTPKKGILLIKKHKKSQTSADIVLEEMEEDKRLITGEVLNNGEIYEKGCTVIFGKYALFPLTLQGEDYFFLDQEDVIGVCDYQE